MTTETENLSSEEIPTLIKHVKIPSRLFNFVNPANPTSKVLELEVTPLFPTPFAKVKIPIEYYKYFPMLMQEPVKPIEKTTTHLYSYNNYVLNLSKYKELKNFIQTATQSFLGEVLMIKGKSRITQSWLNQNGPGHHTHTHIHPNSIVSGVLYVQTTKENGFIKFHKAGGLNNGNDYSWSMAPTQYENVPQDNPYSWGNFSVGVETGDLIMFPSYFTHSVPKNETQDDRWSLAYNSVTHDAIGDDEMLTHLPCEERSI